MSRPVRLGLLTPSSNTVLEPVVSAMLARGVEPFAAACAGVLAHARAGRVAADLVGTDSVIETDVIASVSAGLIA